MARDNKTCLVCSGSYRYCPDCQEYAHLPTFMTTFCSEKCKDLMMIAGDFKAGSLAKEKAVEQLKKIDVTEIKPNYSNGIQKALKEIFGGSKLKEIVKEAKEEVKDEVKAEDTTVEEVKTEVQTEDTKDNKGKSESKNKNTFSYSRKK